MCVLGVHMGAVLPYFSHDGPWYRKMLLFQNKFISVTNYVLPLQESCSSGLYSIQNGIVGQGHEEKFLKLFSLKERLF